MIDLDDIDRAMIRAVADDALISAGALGRKLGLSQPAAWRRLKRLRDAGVFRRQRLDLDAQALDRSDGIPGDQAGHQRSGEP